MSYTKNITGSALPALELLHGDNDGIFEIRILVPAELNKKSTYLGYFDNAESAYVALTEFKLSWSAAYVTLHEVDRALFNKAPNRIIRGYRGDGTPDDGIVRRRWIAVDLDPLRWPKLQPSTEEERDHAIEVARNVARFCSFRGMPEPILGDSGNGSHLLWRCDFPADSDLHKRMLIEIASKFNSERIEIDLTIANPSRIWKVYGTLARKGVSTQERQFRYSRLLHIPENIVTLTEKDITNWIPPVGKESRVLIYKEDGSTKEYKSREKEEPTIQVPVLENRRDGGGIKSDVAEMSAKTMEFDALAKVWSWGLETLEPFRKGDLTVHELKTCPCNRQLKDRSSALYIMPTGAAGFGCKHASCDYSESGGNRWKDLRAEYDKDGGAREAVSSRNIAEALSGLEPSKPVVEKDTKKQKAKLSIETKSSDSFDDWAFLGDSPFFDDDIAGIGGLDKEAKPDIGTADKKPKKNISIVNDVKPIRSIDDDGMDFGGFLGDLSNNTIIQDSDESPDADPEILRPVKMNDRIVRSPDGRRMVNTKDDYNTIYEHVFQEVSCKEDVFTAQGRLAYVDTDKSVMVPFETGGLDRLAWRACEFVEYKKTMAGFVSKAAAVPKRIVESLSEIDHKDRKHLREVNQVVRSPFYTSAGTLVTEIGFNKESNTYLIDCPQLEYMGDVKDCLKYLHDVVSDFPFQTDAERANFIGTWLTPLVRSMISGPVPMTVIEANKRGTGKTKLAQIVQLTYGLHPEVGDLPKEEENMEKLMLSIIVEGKPIHLFDNVKHSVNSACLDRILTTGHYSGRLLGKTKNLHCEVLQLFIMTSNNTRMSEDMSRRFARVRLRTNLRNPERRSDIDKVDILSWTKTNRSKILSALSGLVQNWLEDGSPIPESLPRLGSFEGWRNVVGSILFAAGETEWMQNLDEAMNDTLIVDEWEQFVEHWYMEIGMRTKLTSLLGLCEKKSLFGGLLRGETGQKLHNLRMAILDKRDAVIGDYRITVEKDKHTKTLEYILEKIDWKQTKSTGPAVVMPNLDL